LAQAQTSKQSTRAMVPNPPAEALGSVPTFGLDDREGYQTYFREEGFVVVRGVLDTASVDGSVSELWKSPSLLGAFPHLKRDDPGTWGNESWPAGSRNFLDPLDPCAEAQSWRNRVHPAVGEVFALLWHTVLHSDTERTELGDGEGHLVVSVDRFGVMRPTRPRGCPERPEWRTSRNWLHWDQNPWMHPGFYAMQGFLALSECSSTSGAFVTVPGFHKEFAKWSEERPRLVSFTLVTIVSNATAPRLQKTITAVVPTDHCLRTEHHPSGFKHLIQVLRTVDTEMEALDY